METIRLSEVGVEAAALRAAEILRGGGVILYPTDTLYGLGADALSDDAVAKVKRIKGRDEGKPIHAIVEDLAAAEAFAVIDASAKLLAKAFWPGSLTLILKKRENVETGISRGIRTFGVRVPNNEFCLALAHEFGKPYTGTSANRSGEVPERSLEKVLTQLGSVVRAIDIVIDAGELQASLPSTVVDTTSSTPVILREGTISASDIWNVVRAEL